MSPPSSLTSGTIVIDRVESSSGSGSEGANGHGSTLNRNRNGHRKGLRMRKRSRILSNGRVVPKGVLEGDEGEEGETVDEDEDDNEQEMMEMEKEKGRMPPPPKSKPQAKPPRIQTDDATAPRRPSLLHTPTSPTSRAWYEFDLAVVVALVSPIGNWITGGDHIKNLFLVSLLIFYLHQIVEVPWNLYKSARPRYAPRPRPLHSKDASTSPAAHYATLASSELRSYELFLLGMTVLSPFFGAILLEYISKPLLGKSTGGWFNATLFVLATGMRPWAHVVERVRGRVEDLKMFVDAHEENRGQAMDELVMRLERMESRLEKMVKKRNDEYQKVLGYVDEVVEGECGGRVRIVEEGLGELKEEVGRVVSYLEREKGKGRIWDSLILSPKKQIEVGKPSPLTPFSITPVSSAQSLMNVNQLDTDAMVVRPSGWVSTVVYDVAWLMFAPIRAAVRMANPRGY